MCVVKAVGLRERVACMDGGYHNKVEKECSVRVVVRLRGMLQFVRKFVTVASWGANSIFENGTYPSPT